jgi:hypothetical protein
MNINIHEEQNYLDKDLSLEDFGLDASMYLDFQSKKKELEQEIAFGEAKMWELKNGSVHSEKIELKGADIGNEIASLEKKTCDLIQENDKTIQSIEKNWLANLSIGTGRCLYFVFIIVYSVWFFLPIIALREKILWIESLGWPLFLCIWGIIFYASFLISDWQERNNFDFDFIDHAIYNLLDSRALFAVLTKV